MNIDEILKDLLSKDNGVIIGLDQKQMLLENWD